MKTPFYLASPENWVKNSHSHFALILRFYHCNLQVKEQSEASCLSSGVELSLPESTLYYETGTVAFPAMPRLTDVHV